MENSREDFEIRLKTTTFIKKNSCGNERKKKITVILVDVEFIVLRSMKLAILSMFKDSNFPKI